MGLTQCCHPIFEDRFTRVVRLTELFSLTPPFPSYYTAAGSWHGPAPSLPFFSSPFQSPNPPGENMETRLEARQGTGGGPCGLTEEGREGVFLSASHAPGPSTSVSEVASAAAVGGRFPLRLKSGVHPAGAGTLLRGGQPERPASLKNAKSQAPGTRCHGNPGARLPGDLVPREGAGLQGRRANEAERPEILGLPRRPGRVDGQELGRGLRGGLRWSPRGARSCGRRGAARVTHHGCGPERRSCR